MAKKTKKTAVKKTSAKSKSSPKTKTKAKAVKTVAKKTVPKSSTSFRSASASTTAQSARVTEYKLFTEDSVRSLEDQVNYHIKKGWAPVGGVVLHGQSTFTQTMVRHED